MYPVNFVVNGDPIYAHGFFLLLGQLAGLGWVVHGAWRRRWSKEEVIPIYREQVVGSLMAQVPARAA